MAGGQKFQAVCKDVVDGCIFGLTRQFFQFMVHVTTLYAKLKNAIRTKQTWDPNWSITCGSRIKASPAVALHRQIQDLPVIPLDIHQN